MTVREALHKLYVRAMTAIWGAARPRARRPRPRVNFAVEALEGRVVPAITWDPIGSFTFRNNLQVWQAGNFVPGQLVRIEADYAAGPAPTDRNVGRVNYPAGQLHLTRDGDRREAMFEAAGGPVRVSAFREDPNDPDDVIRAKLVAQRLANLRALPARLIPDGSVTYGYLVTGNAEVHYRDWVEVQLLYATGPSKGQVTRKIAGHHLQSQPGGPIEFTVPAEWFQQNPPPAGTTHLVTWIDRYNKAAESDESDADNVKAIRLPNIVALKPALTTDGAATIGYRNEGRPFVTSQTLNVQAWYSTSPRWEDRLGAEPIFLSPMDPNLNGARTVVVPRQNLAAPPVRVRYLLTRVDRFDLARESDEGDNTAALALPDLSVAYARLDDEQGLVARVDRSGGAVTPGNPARIEVYWASGPAAAARLGGPLFAQAVTDHATQWVVVPYGRLGTPPPEATHVVVVADPGARLAEAGEANNAAAAALAPAKLSLSARRLDFGDVTVRRSAELELAISNTGWRGSVLRGTLRDPGGPFTIVSVGGDPVRRDFALRGGASVKVRVRFAPGITYFTPTFEEKVGALVVTTHDAAGAREHSVELRGLAVPARPTNFRLVARPATRPDNGLLIMEMHFSSTSGDVNDLFLLPSNGVPLLSGVKFRERLSIKGTAAGPAFKLPDPFKGSLPNPRGGALVEEWSDLTDGLGHFGDIRIAGPNDAYFVDRHGYTGFHPLTAPMTGPLRAASFTVLQQYEVSVAWVDGGRWKPIGPVYEIERSVSRGRDATGSLAWFYAVSKAGHTRRLNLTHLPVGVIPTD